MKKNFWDYVFLLRPSIMIALWTFFMGGVYIANTLNGFIIFDFNNMIYILKIMFLYTLLMGGVYVINQIEDIDTDIKNNKLFILTKGLISKKAATIYAVFLIIIPIVLIFVFNSSILLRVLFILSSMLGIVYSLKPIAFKRKPFLDLLDNTIGYGFIAVIIGFLSTGREFEVHYIVLTLPFVFSMGAVFINTTLMDYYGDKNSNILTTGVYLGFKKSSVLSAFLMFIAFIIAIYNKDIILIISTTLSLIFFVYAAFKPSSKSAALSVKYSAPILTLLLCIIYPYFMIINIIVFIGMIIYYRKRFAIRYPL